MSFPSHFQEISLIKTGILDCLLMKGYHLIIVVNDAAEKRHLEGYFLGKDVTIEVFDYQCVPRHIIDKKIGAILYLKSWNKLSFKRRMLLESLKTNTRGIRYEVEMVVALLSAFIPEKLILWILYNIFSNKELDLLFSKYKPVLVILSWAGTHLTEKMLVRSAKIYHCKTISVDACWDYMEYSPWMPRVDKLLVWNNIMEREAVSYHDYSPEEVSAIGILRCDFYKRKELLWDKEEFFKKNGLDVNKKLIILALTPIWPEALSLKIIKIIRGIKNAPYPFQIYVRLASGMSAKVFNEFCNDPLVHIERGFERTHLISENDIMNLVNLLAYTDILVSVLSTLILESCYFDKPNISLAFESIPRALYERNCIQPLLSQRGIKVVYDENDLISAINTYLLDPNADSAGRKNILEKLCFATDGKASQRALMEIEKLMH